MSSSLTPIALASFAVLAVLIFVVVTLNRRNRIKNFISQLPQLLQAEVVQWKGKSDKETPWYKINNTWVTFQKRSVSAVNSTQITKVDFVFYMPVTNTQREKLYEHLYPLMTKANKGRVIPSNEKEIFKGDEKKRQEENLQGFFSSQLMIAPFQEVFGENSTPLDSQKNEWILRAIFPFKTDLSYLQYWIQTLTDASQKKF